jgi:hypothetical protein
MISQIKTIVPPSVRQAIKKSSRALTGPIRVKPDFLVIGAQKCGTTSLYHYLVQHPLIISATRKQMHFFDNNFNKGITWYRTHFPSTLYRYYFRQVHRKDFLTCEATPYYIFHPLAPSRISRVLPNAKFILLLRNPVDRAYSHYNHEVRKGTERLSFEEGIYKEAERLEGEKERMLKDGSYYSFNYQRHSYLARGRYVEQIKDWLKFFPMERFLILKSEELYKDRVKTLNRIFSFLGLPECELPQYETYNQGGYSKMETAMREQLINYFRPYNEQLYDLLGKDLGWDR